jgi:hypothetical protein
LTSLLLSADRTGLARFPAEIRFFWTEFANRYATTNILFSNKYLPTSSKGADGRHRISPSRGARLRGALGRWRQERQWLLIHSQALRDALLNELATSQNGFSQRKCCPLRARARADCGVKKCLLKSASDGFLQRGMHCAQAPSEKGAKKLHRSV